MNILIIEDEELAAQGLLRQLKKTKAQASVLDTLDTVEAAVTWFESNVAPDLAFFDIQLGDGLSFEIFEKTKVPCPVIFPTAYDAYAIRAFHLNSIDYLLKPVDLEALKKALEKYENWFGEKEMNQSKSNIDPSTLNELLKNLNKRYKTRFMVKVGDKLNPIAVTDIKYFWAENKIVWMRHSNGRKYPIDYKMEELGDMLDPLSFFRINRSYLVSIEAIKEIVPFSNSRLKVVLPNPPQQEPIIVSRERVGDFKEWLDA